MGADYWRHLATWDADPVAALRRLQETFVAENYNFAEMIQELLKLQRESVDQLRAEGDCFGILDTYENEVKFLEQLTSRPLPSNPWEQITILRQLNDELGIGNVLDIQDVTAKGGLHVARRIGMPELLRLFGREKPTLEDGERTEDQIAERLGRGECVCFPVYEPSGEPKGWWFAGYSLD